MKTKISFILGIMLTALVGSLNGQDVVSTNDAPGQRATTVSCTPDMFRLTSVWASEFTIQNPGVKISVVQATNNTSEPGTEDLSFISSNSGLAGNELNWKMVIGRDLIVPVFNLKNPFMNEILKKGISPEQLTRIFYNTDQQNWGYLYEEAINAPIHIYIVNDESIKSGVTKFLQTDKLPTAGIEVKSNSEVIAAMQNDPYAIGFCKLANVTGPENKGLAENIGLLPIDRNGSGSIDHMENIYKDVNTLMRGVWIGKYPKTLYSNIYAVSKSQPDNSAEIAFLSWVLTDGQRFINANGYCALAGSESQSQLAKIYSSTISVQPVEKASNTGLLLLVTAMLIALGVAVSAGVRHYKKQTTVIPDMNDTLPNFDESKVMIPKGIYFTKSHTWAFMEKDGLVTLGIDDFLQHITGPITRVEMKNQGEKIKKGDLLFSIVQMGKQLNLYAPVSGIITKQNEELNTDSSIINSSPYSNGWVYKIEPSNWFKEIQFLDMAEKYKKWINTEFSRIKDFLAAALKPDSLEYSHVVLQDGGVIKEGVLADFGPEVWEDFQTNFLDTYK
jgi:glycine cleavage system H lipoate-binding protein/ABC-type phosphate transport system substrate-binding protein